MYAFYILAHVTRVFKRTSVTEAKPLLYILVVVVQTVPLFVAPSYPLFFTSYELILCAVGVENIFGNCIRLGLKYQTLVASRVK